MRVRAREVYVVQRGRQKKYGPPEGPHFIYCVFAVIMYNISAITATGVHTRDQQRYRRLTE